VEKLIPQDKDKLLRNIIQVPRNINITNLSLLINKDPKEMLEKIHEITNELIQDEFQIMSAEATELLCMEYD